MRPQPDAGLRERVRRLPGMEGLLGALEGLPPVYLVGGAVRDLLRGAEAVDLDLAIEGDARSAARALAERLDGEIREHERFGTATRAGARPGPGPGHHPARDLRGARGAAAGRGRAASRTTCAAAISP